MPIGGLTFAVVGCAYVLRCVNRCTTRSPRPDSARATRLGCVRIPAVLEWADVVCLPLPKMMLSSWVAGVNAGDAGPAAPRLACACIIAEFAFAALGSAIVWEDTRSYFVCFATLWTLLAFSVPLMRTTLFAPFLILTPFLLTLALYACMYLQWDPYGIVSEPYRGKLPHVVLIPFLAIMSTYLTTAASAALLFAKNMRAVPCASSVALGLPVLWRAIDFRGTCRLIEDDVRPDTIGAEGCASACSPLRLLQLRRALEASCAVFYLFVVAVSCWHSARTRNIVLHGASLGVSPMRDNKSSTLHELHRVLHVGPANSLADIVWAYQAPPRVVDMSRDNFVGLWRSGFPHLAPSESLVQRHSALGLQAWQTHPAHSRLHSGGQPLHLVFRKAFASRTSEGAIILFTETQDAFPQVRGMENNFDFLLQILRNHKKRTLDDGYTITRDGNLFRRMIVGHHIGVGDTCAARIEEFIQQNPQLNDANPMCHSPNVEFDVTCTLDLCAPTFFFQDVSLQLTIVDMQQTPPLPPPLPPHPPHLP